jgi:hypothetical protein
VLSSTGGFLKANNFPAVLHGRRGFSPVHTLPDVIRFLVKYYKNMAEITTAIGQATILFGVMATLAITVTGFFVGRAWLNRVK